MCFECVQCLNQLQWNDSLFKCDEWISQAFYVLKWMMLGLVQVFDLKMLCLSEDDDMK